MKAYNSMDLYVANKVAGKINSPQFSKKYAELLTTASLIRKNNAKVIAGQAALSKMRAEPGSPKDTIPNMAKINAKQQGIMALLDEKLSLGDRFNTALGEAGKILIELPSQAGRHVIMQASELAARMTILSGSLRIRALSVKAGDVLKTTSELEGILGEAIARKKGDISASIPRALKDDVEDMLFAVAQKTVPEGVRGKFRALLGQHIYANANFKAFEFEKGSVDKSNSELYFRLTRKELSEFVRAKVPKIGFDMMVSKVGGFAGQKKPANFLTAHFQKGKAEAAKAALDMLSDISAEAYGKQ